MAKFDMPEMSAKDLELYADMMNAEKAADDVVDKSELSTEAKHKLNEFRDAYNSGNYATVVEVYPVLMKAWKELLYKYTFAGNRQEEVVQAARMTRISYIKAKAALIS